MNRKHLLAPLFALILLLVASVAPASADPNCSGVVYDPPSAWDSVYIPNVGASNVYIREFRADIEVQDAKVTGSGPGKSYIEIRQSGDSGVANLGVRYGPGGAANYFVFLRDHNGVIKANFHNGLLTDGWHQFKILHPDIFTFEFYVDGVRVYRWWGANSGEFEANQKTLINGADMPSNQTPGGLQNAVSFTSIYTVTNWGTVHGIPINVQGAGNHQWMSWSSQNYIWSWDDRCNW